MARTLVVLPLLLLLTACSTRIVHTTPALQKVAAQANLAKYQRIWVAGFLTDQKAELDINTEVVRLLRQELRDVPSTIVDARPIVIDSQERFADVEYWKRHGEEYGYPLIVTGSVSLILAPPAITQRGNRSVFVPLAGRVLDATVVLIDGRTGTTMSSQKLPSRMRYGMGRFSSGMWLFFQLMDQAMPDWFRAMASQAPV